MTAVQETVIAPRGTTWSDADIYSPRFGDSGHTRQAYWYRLRTHRDHGWRHEAACYWMRLNYYDSQGNLWQSNRLAVLDDFGNLVEVPRA